MARVRGIKQPHPLGSLPSPADVQPLRAASGGTTSSSHGGVKISALPAAGAANDTDQFEVNQAGTSRRVTLDQMAALVGGVTLADDIYSYGADGAGGATDLAALDAMLATQVEDLPRLHVWAKTSVDVGSLIPGPDTVDPLPYLRKIFAAFDTPGLQGRHFIFGRQRAWNFQTRPVDGFGPQGQYMVPPQRCTLEWQRELDFSTYGAAGSPIIFGRQGSYGAIKSVVGDALQWATTITLAAGQAAGLVRGDRLVIYTTAQQDTLVGSWTLYDAGVTSRAENIVVRSVAGDVITLQSELQDDYPAGTTPVVKQYLDQPEIRCVNPMAIGPELVGDDRFLDFRLARNMVSEGGVIHRFPQAYRLYSTLGGSIEDMTIYGIVDSAAGGGISIGDNTQDLNVRNCITHAGAQMFMLTNSGGGWGVSRNISFTDCTAHSPQTGFSTHNMHSRIRYRNCVTNNSWSWGMDLRCPDIMVTDCTVRGCERAAVLTRTQTRDLIVDGLLVEDSATGFQVEDQVDYDYPPGDITVINSRFLRIGQPMPLGGASHGAICFDYGEVSGDFSVLGKIVVKNNEIRMKSNHTAIDLGGRWTSPEIVGNTIGVPAGYSPIGISIHLHAPAGGAATDVPSNPVVTDNVVSASYNAPVIAGASGVTTLRNNVLLGFSSTESVALTTATTLVASQTGSSFTNLGALSEITITLPAAIDSRQQFEIYVLSATGVNIVSSRLLAIRIGSATPAINLRSTTVGAWARLTMITSDLWMAEVDDPTHWTQDWSPHALGSGLLHWWDVLAPPSDSAAGGFRWRDIKGYSPDLQQQVEADKPVFDGVAIDFAGSKSLVMNTPPPDVPLGNAPGCIWASVVNDASVAEIDQRHIFSYGSLAATTRAVGRIVTTGVNRGLISIGDGTTRIFGNNAVDFTGPHYIALIYDGTNAWCKVDGTSAGPFAVAATTTDERLRAGASSVSTASLHFQQKIKRVLLTNVLSAPDQTALEAWLAARI